MARASHCCADCTTSCAGLVPGCHTLGVTLTHLVTETQHHASTQTESENRLCLVNIERSHALALGQKLVQLFLSKQGAYTKSTKMAFKCFSVSLIIMMMLLGAANAQVSAKAGTELQAH